MTGQPMEKFLEYYYYQLKKYQNQKPIDLPPIKSHHQGMNFLTSLSAALTRGQRYYVAWMTAVRPGVD